MILLMPHNQIDGEALRWRPWEVRLDNQPGTQVDEMLHGWDYASELSLSCAAQFEVNEILSQSGVVRLDQLSVYVKVDCNASFFQSSSTTCFSEASPDGLLEARLEVPAGVLAEVVKLERGVVLTSEGAQRTPDAPTRRGHVLHREEARLVLEGDGGRMPVEVVSFAGWRWSESPWRVQIEYEDLSQDSFARATTVLLNADHPAASSLLAPSSAGFAATVRLLRVDVVRAHLLRVVAADVPVPYEPDPDSVAGVLEAHCGAAFDASLSDVLAQMRSDPEDVEVGLKHHFRYLWEAQR